MVEGNDDEFTRKVRKLNDEFRKTLNGGIKLVTEGVRAQGAESLKEIFNKVRNFDEFTPDNDPYGEHDFGSIEHQGETIFWKIDYYDPDCEMHSEDKADPSKTTRILTIMMNWEY